jgi:hypothetical protein
MPIETYTEVGDQSEFMAFKFELHAALSLVGFQNNNHDISGKRANVWGVSEWPLRMACCCFESRPMTMQRVIRI